MSLAARLAANAEAIRSLARAGRRVTLRASAIRALADDLAAGAGEALALEIRAHLDTPQPAEPRRPKPRRPR